MAYSMQKSRVAKGVGVTLIVLLAACTSDQRYKRQINGNEEYLKAPSLHALSSPSGMILPLQNGDYEIPAVTRNGAVGKGLDIRPPAQPLALLNGSRSQYSGNSAASGLQQLNDERANRIAQGETADLSVQSGADESGLPLLVVRSPYNAVWTHLPAAFSRIGMKVKDSSRPLGTVSVTYDAPGSGTWDDLGAKDPDLRNGDYKLQVGDLGNRSTLQFTDPKGHTLTQSQNDALVAVFQAAFSQSSTR
ncbi:outer membrane protein assembly factor BamC [Sodalis sp. (in: enterobacteria)]|uniref:outer membrane protein assembly factor BamC n=1 Tax=Sodalis sp. (in: enterobacteria) TaxID=1898979 RepID=UPI003F39E647